jgi:exopolysaccharide biosynthesis WecB/TagA/CpsF family protein
MPVITFLGLDCNDLSAAEAVQHLLARPRHAAFTYIVTPNADHFARLNRQPELRAIYQSAWLRLLDSRVLAHAARLLRLPAPPVATGADITAALLDALEPQTITIIGLAPSLMAKLRARYPAQNFLHHAPPRNLLGDDLAFIRARDFAVRANARFAFIALGSPVQELLANAIAQQPGSTGLGLCIGAALEYCAGIPRAPAWMQRAGLEWLHRLARNPARLARRYLITDPPVLLALLASKFSQTASQLPPRQSPQPKPASISARDPYPPPPPEPLQRIPDAG